MRSTNPQARVVLLGTGGTIAATAKQATILTDYTVTEDIASMLDAVPGARALADIHCEQISNVDSSELTTAMVLRLARRIEALVLDPEVDGIVVTHGTDTLEETAFFLHLTLHTPKAIVLVGAMRPASALSADGPLNLYNALLLASHADSRGRGILLMMNDQILAARYAAKSHTTRVDAFNTSGPGALGWISHGAPHIIQGLSHTSLPTFALKGLGRLPRVDILYDHQDAGVHLYEASIAAGSSGIVIAGTGNGSLSPGAHKGSALARRKGLICVRSSRVPHGEVGAREADATTGMICSYGLNPQQSRILLMLALARGLDQIAIQARFKAC